MSRDLTKEMKKADDTTRRRKSFREDVYASFVTRRKWSDKNAYKLFAEMPVEYLYDNLIEYRLSLNYIANRNEIAALATITNRLPHPYVPKLIEYMNKKQIPSFAVALAEFMKQQKVIIAMKVSQQLLNKRKAVPAGYARTEIVYEDKPCRNSCVSEYRNAGWVSVVLKKNVTVQAMVSRRKLGSAVKPGWYRLPDKWYENVCRFGRTFRENYIGYILDDGTILEENMALFNASTNFFQYTGGLSDCILQYLNAPWMNFKFNCGVSTLVARKTDSTRDWIGPELKNIPGWHYLRMKWVSRVCSAGREFIKGDIGYLLNDGRVVEENLDFYESSKAYVEKMKRSKVTCSYSCEPASIIIPTIRHGGRSAIGMVARYGPQTAEWIVSKPIPGTDWYRLKKSWYYHILENGREWQPKMFGYRFVNNEIIEETEEMYRQLMSLDSTSSYSEHDIESAKRILKDVLPDNEIDVLLEHIGGESVDMFVDTVARIKVF